MFYFTHISKELRINRQIKAPLLRLIDENEQQIGEVSLEQALSMAQEAELDLVEVAPLAKPPVCKILDYGKYLYRQRKQEQKQKKLQKKVEMKTIRLSLRIDDHDLQVKAAQAKKFVEEKNSVKVSLMFRGREAAHENLGTEKMKYFTELLKDVAQLEAPAKRQGNAIHMVLIPLKK